MVKTRAAPKDLDWKSVGARLDARQPWQAGQCVQGTLAATTIDVLPVGVRYDLCLRAALYPTLLGGDLGVRGWSLTRPV